MWDFTPFGLLMPAAVPMDKADKKLTEDGKYDLQVRGRAASHLRYFMDHYMVPGTFHDEIELTPNMDYNARFYTTREAYADGMRGVILDIDYKKFKPTAEAKDAEGNLKYGTAADTKLYHSVLNSIWGSVCRIGSPGGFYGMKSADNPYGYDRARSYPKFGRGRSQYPALGSTFGTRDSELDPEFSDSENWNEGWFEDFVPDSERETEKILDELELAGIPVDQWSDYLTEHEFELVKKHMPEAARRERKENREFKRDQARRDRSKKSPRRRSGGRHSAKQR